MTERIDTELVARWIEALEGDRYRQGEQYLHPTPETFCCLGVLCDLIDPAAWDDDGRWHGEHAVLPGIAHRRVGLNENGGRPDGSAWDLPVHEHDENALAPANDAGASFGQIAAALRDYYGMPNAVRRAE
jgi:hypothetical protein